MRGVLLALWILTSSSMAVAQETPVEAQVHVDAETGERYVEQRPSEPLRQGALVAPPWVIYTAGGAIIVAAVFFLVRRLGRS